MIKWEGIVESAIERLIREFQAHPFAFVYEADVQTCFWNYINEKIPTSERFKNGFRDYIYHPKSELTIAMHPLMSLIPEQRTKKQLKFYGRGHLDIGIWDTEHRNFIENDYRNKPLRLGIEFKLNEEPKIKYTILYNFNADIHKLVFLAEKYNPVFSGYALWFLPNVKKSIPKRFFNIIHNNVKNNSKIFAKAITPTKVIDFNNKI